MWHKAFWTKIPFDKEKYYPATLKINTLLRGNRGARGHSSGRTGVIIRLEARHRSKRGKFSRAVQAKFPGRAASSGRQQSQH